LNPTDNSGILGNGELVEKLADSDDDEFSETDKSSGSDFHDGNDGNEIVRLTNSSFL
jgi:hypothetical protein